MDRETQTENLIDTNVPESTVTPAESTNALVQATELNLQATEILNKIIAEKDTERVKDLTYLFNISQNKKTMARVDACNDVLDSMLAQWAKRVAERPDEMSNEDILRGVKVIQDLMERGQRQVAEVNDVAPPLIQINQQNNEINMGNDRAPLNRDQREHVKKAVMSLLAGLNAQEIPAQVVEPVEVEVIDNDD